MFDMLTEQTTELGEGRALSLEALAESEQRCRTLVEALPDAIFVHTENKIVFANPFCERMLGARNPNQLLGKDISEIIHPDYLSIIKERIRQCYFSGEASSPMESTMLRCDGSSVEIEAVAIPISWNGAPAIEVVARDISKRKRAERAADEWQKRLELAQKAGLRIGLWDWNLATNTVKWSEETYRQFGYTKDTFSGRTETAVTRIHPDDRPRVENAIQKVLAGAEDYSEQYRLVRPDGSTCWIDAHGVLVRNGSTHMIGIGVDITHLMMTEQSLQESQEKYRLLLNSTAEAIYGLDLEGLCTFCNPACLRLLGYDSSDQLLGKNMHALMHHSRPGGTPYPDKECKIHVAIRQGSAAHVSDEVLWRADSTSFPAEYWSYPMYKEGKVVGAVVTFLDISDRKTAEHALRESEEKYRELFENAIYGIYRSTFDGSLLDVNPALVTILGYSSREELLTRNLDHDIYEDLAARRSILERYGPSGRVDGAEVRWKRKDGKTISVRLSGRCVRKHDGSISHFEVIVEDITERRNLEEQFRQAQKMEAIGLLAGGISHDFNNLLSVILGNAELLLETAQTSTQQRYGEEIKKATSRASQLTRQLLAFSRKQVINPTVLDINAVVRDVGKILQRLIGEDVKVITDLDPHLAAIRADRGQIEQILMNLATNARDAMPSGGTFTLRTENAILDASDVKRHHYVVPGPYIRLSVSDSGMGMSEEVKSRVFEPFFTTKPPGRGTGLGMATVYSTVKQSDGYVWISSAPQSGTTFDIYLPRVQETASPLPAGDKVRIDDFKRTETILLLEDEEALREITSEFLTASGYTVLQACRGDQAIKMATEHLGSIPLVLSDVILPDMSGPSIVARVQAIHPEAKALYVSGYAEVPVAQKLISEGASLLQKPVSQRDLLFAVDHMLHVSASSSRI